MTFVVLGAPATKGSTVSFMGAHGIVTTSDCKGLAAWTQAVGWAAKFSGVVLVPPPRPVRVRVAFQFTRPKSDRTRIHHTVRPDIDKLARALLDALTGVGYHDDAQVVELTVEKSYGDDTRTTIHVEAL